MTVGRRMWFHIEQTFTEIKARCETAKQQSTSSKESEAGLPLKPLLDPAWTLTPKTRRPMTRERTVSAKNDSTGPDIVELRGQIRRLLSGLRSKLAPHLSERELYYALFPIVVYTDEMIRSSTEGQAMAWQPLQYELFQVDNGGELFFNLIDTLLDQDVPPSLILEIFYFCLKDGFLGRHQGQPQQIEAVMNRLSRYIDVEPVPPPRRAVPEDDVPMIAFPFHYYAVASAIVLGSFGLFHLLAYLQTSGS